MKADSSSPMDKAISLLEYVIKTDGAEHLKIASRKMSFFCLYSIDALLFYVLLFAISSFYLTKPILSFIKKFQNKN
jgi:hypothetical protein